MVICLPWRYPASPTIQLQRDIDEALPSVSNTSSFLQAGNLHPGQFPGTGPKNNEHEAELLSGQFIDNVSTLRLPAAGQINWSGPSFRVKLNLWHNSTAILLPHELQIPIDPVQKRRLAPETQRLDHRPTLVNWFIFKQAHTYCRQQMGGAAVRRRPTH